MQNQITVRLSSELYSKVGRLAEKLHLKRSDIVRLALERFASDAANQSTGQPPGPYGMVSDLIGGYASSEPDLGESHRDHLIKNLRKHNDVDS